MTLEPVRSLIVDDDYYAREALRSLLARDPRTRVWGAFAEVDEALAALHAARLEHAPLPEVILLDIRLNEREHGGIEALPSLREADPNARVLMTSVSRDEATVVAAIEAGGDGYIWKNESANGIANAVALVAQGRFVLTQSIADRIVGTVATLALHAAEVLPDPDVIAMTDAVRSTVYLYCVCGMSAREIASELQVSVNTVNSRIRSAYQVLGAGSRREAFERFVGGVGF